MSTAQATATADKVPCFEQRTYNDLRVNNDVYVSRNILDLDAPSRLSGTESTSGFNRNTPYDQITSDKVISSTEKLIAEIDGVILGVSADSIKVRLGQSTIVNFPSILFEDFSFIEYGKNVKYQILLDDEGYRYQNFIPFEPKLEEDRERDSILSMLDSI